MNVMKKRLAAAGISGVLGAAMLTGVLSGCSGSSQSDRQSLSYQVFAPDQLEDEGISPLGDGPLPQEGWNVSGDDLQVQLISGSVPGVSVSDVSITEGGEVTVSLDTPQGPSTMDAALFEVMIDTDGKEVKSVEVDRGGETEPAPLEQIG